MPLQHHTNDNSEPTQVTGHRWTGQPVDDNDDHEEGKDARANWCNEDASDDDDEMAPHFRFERL